MNGTKYFACLLTAADGYAGRGFARHHLSEVAQSAIAASIRLGEHSTRVPASVSSIPSPVRWDQRAVPRALQVAR